jgi:hypothetical protein
MRARGSLTSKRLFTRTWAQGAELATTERTRMTRPPHMRLAPSASVIVALLLSGCGGSSASSNSAAQTPTATQASTTAATPAPALHLAILAPRAGSHTGSTLTVHVAVSGEPSGTSAHFRYVLDHDPSRTGSSHLTFHDIAPGRHRLAVLTTTGGGRASTTFIVRAPAPVSVAAPVEATHTTTTPVQVPHEDRAPEAVHTTAKPPPKPAPKPAPEPTQTAPVEPSNGIPQGNGGDGDGDNNGAPSDGDGNI